mgnify:CR=1 FL=1
MLVMIFEDDAAHDSTHEGLGVETLHGIPISFCYTVFCYYPIDKK